MSVGSEGDSEKEALRGDRDSFLLFFLSLVLFLLVAPPLFSYSHRCSDLFSLSALAVHPPGRHQLLAGGRAGPRATTLWGGGTGDSTDSPFPSASVPAHHSHR